MTTPTAPSPTLPVTPPAPLTWLAGGEGEPPLGGHARLRLPRVGFDTETHLAVRGRAVPRMVCLSLAWRGEEVDMPSDAALRAIGGPFSIHADTADRIMRDGPVDRGEPTTLALLTGPRAISTYAALVDSAAAGEIDLVAQNANFDLAVMAEAGATRPGLDGRVRPILRETLAALHDGAVRCTFVREKLLAIAHDRLRGAPRGWFGLAGLAERYLGLDRSGEKGAFETCPTCGGSGVGSGEPIRNEHRPPSSCTWYMPTFVPCPTCDGYGSVGPWRLRYAQLDGVPLDRWPGRAVSYALDDAIDALLVADRQDDAHPTSVGPIVDLRGHVVDEVPQTRTALAFDLAAAWGVCVDPDQTTTLDDRVSVIVAEANEIGLRAGFIRGPTGLATADPGQKRGRPGSVCKAALHALVIASYGGDKVVPRNDPTDNMKTFAEAEGVDPDDLVGSVKADRDTLLASGNDDLVEYAERGSDLTIARTYVPILREGVALGPVLGSAPAGAPDGRHVCGPVTSRPNVLVASGRASWGQPNWTNPPRDGGFRDCVVPRPGCVFVTADYSTAEFRAFGQICLWEGFGGSIVEAFVAKRDVHTDFAADVLQIPYDEAVARVAAGDEQVKGQRQIAKVGNYGFLGGMSGSRFVVHARNQNTPLHEDREKALEIAWFMHGAFRQKWSESVPYFAWIGRRTGTKEDPRRFVARQYVSGRLRGGLGYTDGCNTYFQGLVADGAKAAVWEATRATLGEGEGRRGGPARALLGSRVVLFLHDEVIIEVPCGDGSARYPLDAAHLTTAAAALQGVMVRAMQPYMPDLPVEADAAAMLRWIKGAKTTWRGGEAGGTAGGTAGTAGGAGRVLVPCDWPEDGVFR